MSSGWMVADQRLNPTFTADLATGLIEAVERDARGILHVTNSGECSWYEFAAEIFRLAGLKPSLTAITSAEFGAAARRPAYSVLSNAKLASAGVTPPRPWQEALAAYLAERTAKSA